MLFFKHYFLSNATAPPQLNACWGDFPGKSPPTKRNILDPAGWVHYNRVRHPHTTSLLCRICVVFRQDRSKNSGPVLYTAAPVEKQMVGQYLGGEIWLNRWFPGTINSLQNSQRLCSLPRLPTVKPPTVFFEKNPVPEETEWFTKSPHSKIQLYVIHMLNHQPYQPSSDGTSRTLTPALSGCTRATAGWPTGAIQRAGVWVIGYAWLFQYVFSIVVQIP